MLTRFIELAGVDREWNVFWGARPRAPDHDADYNRQQKYRDLQYAELALDGHAASLS